MRGLRVPVLSTVALVCGLALTGCSGPSSSGSASGSSAGPGASSAPAPSASSSSSAAATGGTSSGGSSSGGTSSGGTSSSGGSSGGTTSGSASGSASGGTSGGSGSGSGGSGAATRCTTAGLGFAVAPGSGAQSVGEQGAVVVALTNKGGATCLLNGYPGVDLVGDDTWSLTRQTSQKPRQVTLAPGASTSFTITYLSYDPASGSVEFKPRKIVVTPPGETHSTTLTWDFSSVLRQDAATRPGTYVGPVGGR
ncbi:DUF4232 domain-containing protein [Streptomyces sp. SR27]|uniref:DUF4232 domain-containing protein n=1 Tax=Streptomyces sp. SR27 TaxID=3076630 RepID=UPI00295BF2C2|nr:DUF4232 domain-containing protein [Streptomyces sp. SR27]MDV9188539.1 DUF4232 domain-containing protein [Streptomyces sp. SR27]